MEEVEERRSQEVTELNRPRLSMITEGEEVEESDRKERLHGTSSELFQHWHIKSVVLSYGERKHNQRREST